MANTTDTREQHYIDPVTKERKSFRVRSIASRFKLGKGGAISGAVENGAGPVKTLNSGKKDS